MDGVIVDTEAYYQIEQREFFEEFGIEVSDEELLAPVGASFQSFQRSLVDWLGRIGRVVTPDEALRIYRDWKNGREVDYAALMNPGVHEVLAGLKERGERHTHAARSFSVNAFLLGREKPGIEPVPSPLVS